MRARRARATAVALATVMTAYVTGWSSASAAPAGTQAAAQAPGSTLDRSVDAVVVTGQQASGLAGTAPNRVVAFRASEGQWQQIPVQVDERKQTTMAAVYGLPTTQTFYGSSINVPVNVYADANTFTGADTDTNVDADDEIVFMARDAGGARGSLGNPTGTTGNPIEVKLAEPTDANRTGYVYLFSSSGSLDPSAGERYVDYQFRLNSGDYRTTYKRTDGPNPENSTVTGRTYTAHYSDRWTLDQLAFRQGSRPGVDMIDRVKYDIQLACARNENTFNDEEGAFVVNKSGPVRAIRSWVGSNSGPNTQNTQVWYDSAVVTNINLRVHAIPNVGSHIDFSRDALGMTYRNAQVPNGVPIDGQPDTVPTTGPPNWWTYSGPQGGLAVGATYDVDATSPAQTAYVDDETPSITQCTGDQQAIGDSGAFFGSWINCTDPGLGCTQKLNSSFRVVANPPSVTPAELQRQGDQFRNPLTVTVNGQGGGPGPDPGQCVRAANSAHVQAGRATAFLIFVWAAGSSTYLGVTSATTSLRQSSPGVWARVDSC
jgi:hypothetical protein